MDLIKSHIHLTKEIERFSQQNKADFPMFIWKKSVAQELHFNLPNGEAINQSFKRKGIYKKSSQRVRTNRMSVIVPCHFTAMT